MNYSQVSSHTTCQPARRIPRFGTFAIVCISIACSMNNSLADDPSDNPRYKPKWASLEQHVAAPEWFQDAKFGIYFHWGVYSVPAYGNEWYPRNMNLPGNDAYKHHLETYGRPADVGYHEFVPQFHAKHFDSDEWAELFQAAGARFAGPVAEHHDGFAMWGSECTPWNVVDKGPHRDIMGELFAALRQRNMKTIATFHHARHLQRYAPVEAPQAVNSGFNGSSHYPNFIGWPTGSDDPELRLLYGNLPHKLWLEKIWLGKLKEVIDKYQPDIIWFDSWLDRIPEPYRQEFCAYYLNVASKWDDEVVIVRKQDDLPLSFTVNDHEKARESKAAKEVWMTDDTISTGSWSYTSNLKIKPLSKVLHGLIDTVSKNGVVLLNVSPRADGIIPKDQQEVLRELGAWLRQNGEAIYATRPWTTFGEGPTQEPEGGFRDHQKFLGLEYSAADIRYTASKDGKAIYAILLGTPSPESEVLLKALAELPANGKGSVKSVSFVDGPGPVQFEHNDTGLQLTIPKSIQRSPAVAVKIEVE